jgi:tetratricopeptide (TPR) repeat protein
MELEDEIDEMDKEDLVQRLDDIFNEMSEALVYDDQDVSFLYSLYSLAYPLKYYKIARQALECIIYSDSRVLDVEDAVGQLNPRDVLSLESFKRLLDKIGDEYTVSSDPLLSKFDELKLNPVYLLAQRDYSWLNDRFDVSQSTHKLIAREENRHLDITITTKDWTSIASSLQEVFSTLVKSKRKILFEDPYSFSEQPVTVVKFIMPHGEAVMMGDGSRSASRSLTPEKMEVDEEKITPLAEPTKQTDYDATVRSETNDKPIVIGDGKPNENNDEGNVKEGSKSEDVKMETPPNEEVENEEAMSKKRKRRSDFNLEEANKSRSSKRVRAREGEQTLEAVDVSSDEDFFEQLNTFLALADTCFPTVLPAFLQDEYKPADQYIADFKELLQTWDDAQAEVFLRSEAVPNIKVNKPVMQLLDFAALGNSEALRPTFEPSIKEIENFIMDINTGNYHFQQVRVEFLYCMLCSRNFNDPSILKDFWPQSLTDMVQRMIEAIEPLLYEGIRESLFWTEIKDDDMEEYLKKLEISQAIFEVFLDHYLTLEKNTRNSDKKPASKDQQAARNAAKLRLFRWKALTGDLLSMPLKPNPRLDAVELRNRWVGILSTQIDSDDPNESLCSFERFKEWIEQEDPLFEIGFANFPNIPKLSLASANTQISKFKAASVFAQVFEIRTRDEGEDQDLDRVKILESILMPDEQEVLVPEHDAIAQFLSTASLEFRVQLWYLLLDAYNNNGESQKAFEGYLRILVSSVEELAGEGYTKYDEYERSVVLLRSLNMCLDISRSLVRLVVNGDEGLSDDLVKGLSKDRVKGALDAIIKLLRVLHIFILLDDAIINNIIQAPSHPTWEKASRQIKELIVRSWSLFYLFFRYSLPEEKQTAAILNDTLSIVHEEIGTRGYCGMADSSFLELSLRELMRLSWKESEADMLQCLHCRYGLSLGNDDFQPFDHHATPSDLDRPAAMRLSGFIMDMIFRKKNLTQSILRVDVKSVLDQLYEAIGNPEKSVPAISHNSNIVENYLNTSIIPLKFFDDSLHSRLSLSFVPSTDEIMKVGQGGLYYLLALAQLTVFRIRKRQQPGRTEDLEEAINYFIYDLKCNTNRFESWLGLAQVYDLLAEDDLTWDSDYINLTEERKVPAEHQRKSILACGMAISIYLKSNNSHLSEAASVHFQQLSDGIWTFFSKILYNAAMEPMKMQAFSNPMDRIMCGSEGLYTKTLSTNLDRNRIMRVVHTCLSVAISNNPNDWFNHFLRAKTLHKLSKKPKNVLKCLKTAIELCPEKHGSHNEPVLEPHYKLISMAFKYVREGKIMPEFAIEMAMATPYCEYTAHHLPRVMNGFPDTLEHKFYALCVAALLKIKASDKKRWQHRPSYRLAKIFEGVYGDNNRAKEEMTPFFQVRTTTKTPLHIWKPDLERPGQHFVFTYQYIVYYVRLLGITKDTSALTTLSKKLRKFSSGMAKHGEAWDYTCSVTILSMKEALSIPERFSEQYIPVLNFDQFDSTSQQLQKELEGKKELPYIVGALNYAAELRRLNNGLGSTGPTDDLFVSVYLKIYQEFVRGQNRKLIKPADPSTPGGSTKISITDLITPSAEPSTATGESADVTNNVIVTPSNYATTDNPSGNSTPLPQQSSPTTTMTASAAPAHLSAAPSPNKAGEKEKAPKTRVNRRDIISRATALLKVLQPNINNIESSKLSVSSPSVAKVSSVSSLLDSPEIPNPNSNNPSEFNSPAPQPTVEAAQTTPKPQIAPSTPTDQPQSAGNDQPTDQPQPTLDCDNNQSTASDKMQLD